MNVRRLLAAAAVALYLSGPVRAADSFDRLFGDWAPAAREFALWVGTFALCVVVGLAMWGLDARSGKPKAKTLLFGAASVGSACAAGLVAFMLAYSSGVDAFKSAALAGAAGMLGADRIRKFLISRTPGAGPQSGPMPLDEHTRR